MVDRDQSGKDFSFKVPRPGDISIRSDLVDRGTITNEVYLAELNTFSIEIVNNYLSELKQQAVDEIRLLRVEDFFVRKGGLKKVMSFYQDLLLNGQQITPDEQSLLLGHLNFVLQRGIDQDLNSPQNYVSHNFNHSLWVAGNIDENIEVHPKVIEKFKKEYGLSTEKVRFLLANMALFHDLGYPESESKHLPKVTHSQTGADKINYGLTEVNGEKVAIRGVLGSIFGEKATNDLRDAVLMHNADKFDKSYMVKIVTDQGPFLVDGNDLFVACERLDGIRSISIFSEAKDNNGEKLREWIDRLRGLFIDKEMPKIELVGKKYAGRKLGKNQSLGLEYFKVSLDDENPLLVLLALLRSADNMHIADRVSPPQDEEYFMAYLYALGDEKSLFYEGNKDVEHFYELAQESSPEIKETALQELKAEVLNQILYYRTIKHQTKLTSSLRFKDNWMDDETLQIKIQRLKITINTDLLRQTNYTEVITYWRNFILNQIAEEESIVVDKATKDEVKKVAVKMGSRDFPHFAGCEPVKGVKVDKNAIWVTVDEKKYNELNKIEIREKIQSGDQVSFVTIPAGEYQIWRLYWACEDIVFEEGKKILIYVNGVLYSPY